MLLIITGCIRVEDETPYVVVRDITERLNGYLETIRWAIEETAFTEIVFGDNSAYPLDTVEEVQRLKSLSEDVGKCFEYYSFQGDVDAVRMKGKGYGEGEILAYLYENSSIMQRSRYYYKITGRLTINNIDKIHLSDKPENMFIFDVGGDIRSVDTRFYKIKMKDYKDFFKDAYLSVNDSKNMVLEYVYYAVLAEQHLPFKRFNRSLEFRGKSGSSGTEYCKSFNENILMRVVYRSFLYRTYWGRVILRYIRRISVSVDYSRK